jgi:hypothetical protein
MDITEFAEIIGVLGAVLYVLSYALLQYKRDFAKSITYTLMNIMACLMVLYSTTYYWNLSAAIIQVSWLVISLYGLKRNLNYFSDEEKEKMSFSLSLQRNSHSQ